MVHYTVSSPGPSTSTESPANVDDNEVGVEAEQQEVNEKDPEYSKSKKARSDRITV